MHGRVQLYPGGSPHGRKASPSPVCKQAKFLFSDSGESDNPAGSIPSSWVMYCSGTQKVLELERYEHMIIIKNIPTKKALPKLRNKNRVLTDEPQEPLSVYKSGPFGKQQRLQWKLSSNIPRKYSWGEITEVTEIRNEA